MEIHELTRLNEVVLNRKSRPTWDGFLVTGMIEFKMSYFPSGQMSSTFCLGLCKLISTKSTFFFRLYPLISYVRWNGSGLCCGATRRGIAEPTEIDGKHKASVWSKCFPFLFLKSIFVVMPLKPVNLDKRWLICVFLYPKVVRRHFPFVDESVWQCLNKQRLLSYLTRLFSQSLH